MLQRVCRRLIVSSLLLVFVLLAGAGAESPASTSEWPAAIEIIPRLGQLNARVAGAKNQISALGEASTIQRALEMAESTQQRVDQLIQQLETDGWTYDRLSISRGTAESQRVALARQQEALSLKLQELEALRRNWQDQQAFWRGWRTAVAEQELHGDQQDALNRAEAISAEMLALLAETTRPLVALQNRILQLQQENQRSLAELEEILQALRGRTFQKTEPALTHPEFYRQINKELLTETQRNVRQIVRIDKDFLRERGWVFVFQFLLTCAIGGFIQVKRRKVRIHEEWGFIARHPAATGLFVSLTIFSPLYAALPGSVRLLLIALGAFSTAILASELLKDLRKIVTVHVIALLLVLSSAWQTIPLPTPLYRLYLLLLSLIGIPLLLMQARRVAAASGRSADRFPLALRLGAVILLLVFISQVGGFVTLSSRLLDASTKTVFLGLFAVMAVRLGRGGLDYFFGQPFFRRESFFVQFGEELTDQLKFVYQIGVWSYAVLHLLFIWGWGVFDSPVEVWSALNQLGFTAGGTRLTLRMALLSLAAFYLSIRLSWLVRALLDSEFFPRSAVDRGIRDSIKKLLHYSLVLFGFILALGFLGVTLQNFVILAGAFGIGIGFGLQNIVGNFVSGLILLFERPIKVGDVIVLEENWAVVRNIGLRSTTIETFDLSEIIVPNSDLVSQKVTNWTLSNERNRVVVPVGVAYGSDVEKVRSLLIACAEKHPNVLESPPPSVIFQAFGNSSLDFELRAWVPSLSHRLATRSDLLTSIVQEFARAGVQIPFPQRDLHLRSIDAKLQQSFGLTEKDSAFVPSSETDHKEQ